MQDDIVRGGVPVPLVTQPSDSARILFLEVTCKRLSWRWASVVSQTCVIRPCRLIRGGIVREQWGMKTLEPALSGGVHTERAEWDQAAARRRTRPIRAGGGGSLPMQVGLVRRRGVLDQRYRATLLGYFCTRNLGQCNKVGCGNCLPPFGCAHVATPL